MEREGEDGEEREGKEGEGREGEGREGEWKEGGGGGCYDTRDSFSYCSHQLRSHLQ